MEKENALDKIEIALRAINNPKVTEEKEFQEWIKDADNRDLYNELQLYREAILSQADLNVPSEELAWRDFIEKKQVKRKRRLSPLWLAGAVAIVAIFFITKPFWKEQPDRNAIIIPEFVAQEMPQEITLQADDEAPIALEKIAKMKRRPDIVKEDNAGVVAEAVSVVDMSVDENVQIYTLSIPRGKNYHLVLEDNTEVWLNADSKLKYPDKFASDKRVVELVGEGYFKVAKDENRPFIVKSPYMTTQVLGTEFNLRAYNKDDAGVTLVTGQVCVTLDKSEEFILNPGQNICLLNDELKVSDVDVRKYTCWVEGLFYFDNATLEEIMKDLGRWYNVNIKFEDQKSRNYKFRFWANRANSFKEATEMLNRIGKVSIEVYGNNAIIKEK